jgi:probable aminopeptidase NPEPL1
MPSRLSFVFDPSAFDRSPVRAFVGRRDRLLADDVRARVPAELAGVWEAMVRGTDPGDDGRATTAWTAQGRVVVGVLPEQCSRHNTPTRAWSIPPLVKVGGSSDVGVLVALDDADHAWAAAMAIARAYPSYTASSRPRDIAVQALLLAPGPLPSTAALTTVAEACRKAASYVDLPPNELNTRELVAEAQALAAQVGARCTVISGTDLRDQGFGGLWGVGKASEHPPALVVLDRDGAGDRIAWVGKGITYDTGGLSIKPKLGMVGMKGDLGGAAAVLAAFWAAAKLGIRRPLTAVLCIAENAVGPAATRPDDVLRMYSGRTVEVNNTDAEGRLVLADGVAWVVKHRAPVELIDCATLTGAQAVATGKRHAAIYASTEAIEDRAVHVGRRTGDLVHPLPYAPELYRREFSSVVADLRNSVKDRSNAQSSCAAQFIREHLGSWDGPHLHVDLAAPATSGGRGTGFGVGLLLGLAGVLDG